MKSCGFTNVVVNLKEESREFIKNWLPGSGCEKYVVSAEITANKPLSGQNVTAALDSDACAPVEEGEEGC